MTYKQPSPIIVSEGGTGVKTTTAYGTLTGGITAQAALQNAGTGVADTVLTSLGAGTLPVWLPPPTFFEPLAADPGAPAIGDTWYNTTEHEFKGYVGGALVCWSIESDMNIGRNAHQGIGYGGDFLVADGVLLGSGLVSSSRYNGTTDIWTEKANMNYRRGDHVGGGTANDALVAKWFYDSFGTPQKNSERYNGTTDIWSLKASTTYSQSSGGAGSTADDVLAFQRNIFISPTGWQFKVERYNGFTNNWSTKSDASFYWYAYGSCGSASDAMAFGGVSFVTATSLTTTRLYAGATDSWSTKANLNTARREFDGGGQGNSRLGFGGRLDNSSSFEPIVVGTTEEFDIVANTWTTECDLNYPRYTLAGDGDANLDCLATGGVNSGFLEIYNYKTERYNSTGANVVTFDTTP